MTLSQRRARLYSVPWSFADPAAFAGRAATINQVTHMAHDPKKPAQTAPSKPFTPPPGGKPSQPQQQPYQQPHQQPGGPAKFTDPKKK